MYFGGYKLHPSTEARRSFLRLPASDAQHAEVIGELKAIITLSSPNEPAVSFVVLHHWVLEELPHVTEGLPRLSPTPSTVSCVPIDALIDRVRSAVLAPAQRSPQRASAPHVVADYARHAPCVLNMHIAEIGYSAASPQEVDPDAVDELLYDD